MSLHTPLRVHLQSVENDMLTFLPLQGPSGFPEVRQSNLWDSPPSSPPLAALTTANELALFSKHPTQKREIDGRRTNSRREGAAYTIR